MTPLQKAWTYLQSCWHLKRFHWKGCPFAPRTFIPDAPHYRTAYNQFILWVNRLQLPSAAQIVDIGANHGDFSEAAAALFPKASIILFEPLPSLQAELLKRCERHAPFWQLQTFALGEEPQTLPLHVAEGHDAIGSLAGFSDEYLAANPQARMSSTVECEVRRLDDFIEEQGITGVDLMKIDVEGYEFEVLAGAAKTLRICQSLIVEVSLIRGGNQAQQNLVRLLGILQQAGLNVVEILPSWYSKTEPWLPVEFNVLARRTGGRLAISP